MSSLKLYKRGDWWHCRGTIRGERFRKSLGTDQREIALELAREFEAQIWQGLLDHNRQSRTFERAALSYLELEGDHRFLEPVMRHFKGRIVDEIAPAEIRHAALKIYPNHSPATRNRQAITPAQAVINHAHDLGWCEQIRVKSFPVPKGGGKKPVSGEWLEAFMAEADRVGSSAIGTAVLFMNQTAARRSEAVHLTGEYFLPDEKLAILVKTKTDEFAIAYLTDHLVERMSALNPEPGRPVFGIWEPTGLNKAMKRICRSAKIDQRSPHEAGRHSYGTNAIASGVDVKSTMEGGRWKSASLFLETYVHSNEAGRKVAEILEAGTNLAQNPIEKKIA